MKAKTVSLISKIFSGLFIVVGFCLKAKNIIAVETTDLILVATTVSGLFITVDTNIALDKFSKKQ